MGTFESVTNRLKSERREVAVQARISQSDSETLDEFVDFLDSLGIETSRASAVRALVLDGLEAFKEFKAEAAK